MIQFDPTFTTVLVYDDGVMIGKIIGSPNSYYRYYPLNGEPGEKFHSLIKCKKSIAG